jgi:hypothetical protein
MVIKAKDLVSTLSDNLREVMNICMRLILKDGFPHLRMQQVVPAKQSMATAMSVL